MTKKVCPDPPANLLMRCIGTIPDDTAQIPAQPQLSLEMPSRSRLRWLTLAAAIPVVAVLIVLPAKHYLSLHRQDNSQKDTKETAAKIPYVRREMYLLSNATLKDEKKKYILIINDDRGQFWGYTKPNFKEIDPNPNWNSLYLPNCSYFRERDKVMIRSSSEFPNKRLILKSVTSATNWGMKPFREGTDVWDGMTLNKKEYVHLASAEQKRKGYPSWRREEFTDPKTGLLWGTREWIYFKGDPAQSSGGVLKSEVRCYYEPRPEDDRFFNPAYFTQGAKRIRYFIKPKANP